MRVMVLAEVAMGVATLAAVAVTDSGQYSSSDRQRKEQWQ